MRTFTVVLQDGIQVGETLHKEAELREVNIGDVMAATQAAERPVGVPLPDGQVEYMLLASATAIGFHMTLRRLVRIGDYKGAMTLKLVGRLSPADFALMQAAADKFDDAAARQISREAERRGKS